MLIAHWVATGPCRAVSGWGGDSKIRAPPIPGPSRKKISGSKWGRGGGDRRFVSKNKKPQKLFETLHFTKFSISDLFRPQFSRKFLNI